MADGRRTRWVAHDVYFLDEGLGHAMFERFGGVGIALWHGFIAACKKNHIEGQTSWSSDVEALQVLGLPGMSLVDNDGEPFTLDEWLKLLSDHKVIRRTSRGRRVKVACTKWERWQHDARRAREASRKARERASAEHEQSDDTSLARGSHVPDRASTDARDSEDTSPTGEQNRRSEQENTSPPPGQPPDESLPDTDTDTDTDTTTTSAAADPDVSDDARQLTRHFAERVKANGHSIPTAGTKNRDDWLIEMDRLLRLGPPGEGGHVPDADEVRRVIDWCASDQGNGSYPGEATNVRSVKKFRDRYSELRRKALRPGEATGDRASLIGTGGVA